MSDDGRFVAFQSYASNLVPGDGNEREDVFLLDRRTGRLARVGQPPDGESNDHSIAASLSANGRYLAFESTATNLVPGDTNGAMDAFLLDLRRGTLVRASVDDQGGEGNQQSRAPIVSNNGRWVLFLSLADDLVPGDTNQVFDSFLRDVRRGKTHRVSVGTGGIQGNYGSSRGTLDPRGRYVAFGSHASNLVAGDGNAASDVFVRDLVRGTTVRVTAAHDGGETNGNSHAIAFVGGSTLLVGSAASNLVPGDENGAEELFLLRRR
jgi:Tol biopolymer transport system component